jgi:hypothetical protein
MSHLHKTNLSDLTQAMNMKPGGPGNLCVVMPGGPGGSACVVMPGDA